MGVETPQRIQYRPRELERSSSPQPNNPTQNYYRVLNPLRWLDGDAACHWGFTQSERYSEEDEIQPQGRMGSYTTTLTLEQWIEEIQMWNLQSWDSPSLFNLLTEKIHS